MDRSRIGLDPPPPRLGLLASRRIALLETRRRQAETSWLTPDIRAERAARAARIERVLLACEGVPDALLTPGLVGTLVATITALGEAMEADSVDQFRPLIRGAVALCGGEHGS